MDQPWKRKYQPTAKLQPSSSLAAYPSSSQLAKHKKALAKTTQDLLISPYGPYLWLTRARILQDLGFPDLAVGDAHKARLLIEEPPDDARSAFQNEPAEKKAACTDAVYKCLIECLIDCSALADAKDLYSAWRKRVTTRASADDTALLKRVVQASVAMDQHIPNEIPGRVALLSIGHVFVRDYPWMTDAQIQRDMDLMLTVQAEMKTLTNDSVELRSSNVRGNDNNVWGLFAKKSLEAGDMVLIDPASFAVSDKDADVEHGFVPGSRCTTCRTMFFLPVTSSCPTCKYCCVDCRKAADSTFHSLDQCPEMLPPFPDKTNIGVPATRPTRLDLYARFLSTLIYLAGQDTKVDPLRLGPIARLTVNAGGTETHAFNYHDHIIYPTALLRQAGIDIYTSRQWDTYVLLTIRHRIDNNNHGQYLHGVYPHMAMLNHSCLPNLELDEGEEGGDESGRAVLHLRAEREIKKGEELTVRYTGDPDDGLEQRRYALLHWLGSFCQCERCVREEADDGLDMDGLGIGSDDE